MELQSEREASQPSTSKRKKIATVACQRCRRMKQGCDARKPTCTPCLKRPERCIYERETLVGESRQAATKRELDTMRQQIRDLEQAVEILKTFPDDHGVSILRHIKHADDPLQALASYGQDPRRDSRLKPHAFTRLSGELYQHAEAAYPVLVPVQQDFFRLDHDATTVLPFIDHSTVGVGSSAAAGLGTVQLPYRQDGLRTLTESSIAMNSAVAPAMYGPHPATPWGQHNRRRLCDARLEDINIAHWTTVRISNAQAAEMISLYLHSDHPMMGFFDADSFLFGLSTRHLGYCSSFLVNALLFWCCHGHIRCLEPRASEFASLFQQEAEFLWDQVSAANFEPHVLDVAACNILSLTFACNGKDEQGDKFKEGGRQLAISLGLVPPDILQSHEFMPRIGDGVMPNNLHARAWVAWGAYSWFNFHPAYVPTRQFLSEPAFDIPRSGPPYIGSTFEASCRLRRIGTAISIEYKKTNNVARVISVEFLEHMYRCLLQWARDLRPEQRRTPNAPHHVWVVHMWYHTQIIDLFQPWLEQNPRLEFLSCVDNNATAIYAESISQLKSLVVHYRRHYRGFDSSILWHIALLHIGNAINGGVVTPDYDFMWRECVDGYLHLAESFPLAGGMLSILIVKALETRRISPQDAADLRARLAQIRTNDRIRESAHTVDFNVALTDRSKATLTEVISRG